MDTQQHAGRRAGRTRWRLAVAVGLVAAVLTACTASGSGPQSLFDIKRTYYGRVAQQDAARIAAGTGQALVEFTVESTPPSVFYNYVVPDAQAADFESFIGLPPGFSLTKVKILESDPEPHYWMSLNIYRVSGITNGLRAEWNTYVDDGSGTPRFMIIRARAADGSIDPVGPIAYPEPFQHSLGAGDVITTSLNKTVIQNGKPVLTPDNQFSSTINLPAPADRVPVSGTLEWTAANDFIYWMNGVNDRVLYNSKVHDASMISVDLADVTIANDSEFTPYLEPSPAHVLVYLNRLEFAIGPWWNVTEPDGRVAPATRAALLDFKTNLYSGQASTQALNVQAGNAQPSVRSSVEGAPPGAYWHWKIPAGNLAAFEAALNLPGSLSLAPVKLQEGDATAEYWLSLNVFPVVGHESGLRAEWTTYVHDGTATRAVLIETRADHPSLDPVNRFTDPYPVTHTQGATLDTEVGTGPTAFTSTFPVPAAGPGNTVVAAREWAAAKDLAYWRNGVADRTYYDSSFFRKISVDPATATVVDGGQWAPYVGATPDRVWVNETGFDLVTNPWLGV